MKISKLYAAIRQINEIVEIHGYPRITSYLRFFHLATTKQYSPVEIFMEDLLNPSWSDEARQDMISKECFLRLQEKVNPVSHRSLTEDKVMFHQYCTKHHLAVPELVAVFDAHHASYWGDGRKIETENNIAEGLSAYPYDIIVKPVHGYHGKGVFALDFVEGKHYFSNNPDQPFSDVFERIINENPDQYILQKRLYSHQKIAEFTGNTVLQSLRLITCLNKNNQPRLIIRKIKLAQEGSLIDNFSWGVNEGRLCLVNEYGVIENTIEYDHMKKHLTRRDYVENVDGKKVKFQIPFWEQCVTLVLEAQKAFAPLKTIGWDVAVTDDGPYLIEGNVFWDPLTPQEGHMRQICDLLKHLSGCFKQISPGMAA